MLRAHGIETFFYIGGNDSSDTARILHEQARAADYPLICVHIPKTIDNDLVINDHTPGFPSAARFVALAFAGANLDNRALPGVYVAVVMGRHAGFLTAASALGRKFDDDGPHLIYVPERVFSLDKFVEDVRDVYNKYGRCIVAVSEGIHDETGQPIATKLAEERREGRPRQRPALRHRRARRPAHRPHQGPTPTSPACAATPSATCSAPSWAASPTSTSARPAKSARRRCSTPTSATRNGNHSGSVTIHRTGFYSVDYHLTPLAEIAGKTKVMPAEFIAENGHDVTDKFLLYLRPLLGSGMPEISRLRLNKVPKILKD